MKVVAYSFSTFFAVNLANVKNIVLWHTFDLGFAIEPEQKVSPFMYLLANSSGWVIFEFYYRSDVVITDFALQDSLTFHIAFVSNCTQYNWERLEKKVPFSQKKLKKKRVPIV